MRVRIFTYIIVLFCLMGCSEEPLPPQTERVGFDYFPLQTGLFRTYDVEQIDFSVITSDTSHFQLKELVVDSFLNAENDYTFILHRLSREDETTEWALDSVWTTRRTSTLAVVVENNVSIIKLVFPVASDKEWDGNSLNSRESEIFQITDLNLPLTLGDTTYNETLTVVQSDIEDNLITQDQREETFVRGIGLVQKDFVTLNFCSRDDCLGQGIIESGQILRYNLIEHGRE